MNQNLVVFSNFRQKLSGQHQLKNGNETFTGLIIYNFKGQSLKETLEVTVRLTTSEYGEISIDDGNILNSNIVHMDFSPNWQDYSVNNDGILTINGKSAKCGIYEVKIIQI
ncbi:MULTISPECIES: hypothetical protein [unclassified Chryseobacterium]|uniref:hypothetical protein n=1 Tax=unclassified Chryseobacterium TaxID=2593645 RepID=UPI0030194DE7